MLLLLSPACWLVIKYLVTIEKWWLIARIYCVGLCYAEFGTRVPKAGSAYIYCFVTIGEFIAFLIGWNLILEYSIGAASVTKGITTYVDSISGNVISRFFLENVPINVPGFGQFADFFAFAIIIVVSRESD